MGQGHEVGPVSYTHLDVYKRQVYGDVFTPYIVKCIEEKKDVELNSIFQFLELVLSKQDGYASEVIAFSVIESIEYLLKGNSKYKDMMGNETKKLLEEL